MVLDFKSPWTNEIKANGNITYVYILIAIALFLIVIACINFMNLATARSVSRAREVGIRKVVGSRRGALIQQFLTESLVLSFIGMAVASLLVGGRAGRILTRFGPRQYPAPFAVAVTHTMDALEYLGLSLEMIANLPLYARQVIRMYQAPPVRLALPAIVTEPLRHGMLRIINIDIIPQHEQCHRFVPCYGLPHSFVWRCISCPAAEYDPEACG